MTSNTFQVFLATLALTAIAQIASGKRDLAMEERNKQIVVNFYKKVFGQRDLTGIRGCIAENYIQHSPLLPDGRDAIIGFLESVFPPGTPPFERLLIERVIAEGDWVWIHVLSNFTPHGDPFLDIAVVAIFRLENGLLAEHFNVVQPVPYWSANKHPMFHGLAKAYSPQCGFARVNG